MSWLWQPIPAAGQSGAGATQLIVQDAALVLAADSPALTQHNVLVVADALLALAAESPALTQHNALVVADALLALAADGAVLTQHNIIAVADATIALVVDNVALVQHGVLVVQDATLGLAASAIVLDFAVEEEEPTGAVVLAPDWPQTFRHQKTKEYAFDSFIQEQMDGYIKRERQEAKLQVRQLEGNIATQQASFRAAAETKAGRIGAVQRAEALYLEQQQEELERQRVIMLGLRRDQNIRNLNKGKDKKRGKPR